MLYDLLSNTLVQSLLGLYGFIFTFFIRSAVSRERLGKLLCGKSARVKYRVGMEWILLVIESFYGPSNSKKSMCVSLNLASFYPLFFFLISYSFLNGSNEFSGTLLFADSNPYRFWVFPSIFIGIPWAWFLILVADFISTGISNHIVKKDNVNPFSPKSSIFRIKLGLGVLTYTIIYHFLPSNELDYVLLLIGFSIVAYIVVLLPLKATFTIAALVIAIFTIVSLSQIMTAELTGIIAILSIIGLISTFLAVGYKAVYIVFIIYSIVMVHVAGQVASGAELSTGIFLICIYIMLPLINAAFDWFSWAFSRYYMRKAKDETSWLNLMFDLTVDALIGFLFMLLLCFLLPLAMESLDRLMAYFPSKSGVIAETNWRELALSARDDPWGKGFLVTMMVLTTLIPTLLHLCVGFFAMVSQVFSGSRLAGYLQRMPIEDNFCNMRATAWLMSLICIVFSLVFLLIKSFLLFSGFDVPIFLYDFADLFFTLL